MRPHAKQSTWLDELRWMVEEFKVGLFAPEIKVRFRISAKRLEEKFAEWDGWIASHVLIALISSALSGCVVDSSF